MRRVLLALSIVLAVATSSAIAQQKTVVNENMTVAGSATLFQAATLTALSAPGATCTGVLEAAPIRFTLDGTTPSASVGVPVAVGQRLTIYGYANIAGFQGFRTTSTSGTIYWSCSK